MNTKKSIYAISHASVKNASVSISKKEFKQYREDRESRIQDTAKSTIKK